MKKLIYCAAALATALFAGSCQRELLDPAQGGSTVTYTVNVPEVATKAIGDAQNVNKLVYAVYRVTGENEATAKANLTPEKFVYQDTHPVANGKSTISLELINNQAYLVLFWAQVDNTWFADDYQFGTKTVDYPDKLVANNDKYSAFYGVSYISDVQGPATKDITLHRPFAQINIAANDPQNYNVKINTASVTVANAASGFDVAKEEAIATEDYSVSFAAAPMPGNEKLTVNNVTYETGVQNTGSKENDKHHYVAMNYVFAAGNVNVSYVIETDHGIVSNTITNVPVAKNYRTNIVGNLLTSDVKYNVELDQDWGQPELAPEEIYLAAALGGEVTLTEDVVLTLPLEVNAEMTINLNGYTISGEIEKGNGAIVNIADGASVILNGGTIKNTAPNGDAAINNEGTLVLNGVTIKGAPLADGGYSAYAVISSGNMVIEEGTAISADRGSIKVTGAGETVINGGTFTNNDIGSRSLTSHVVDVEDGSTHKLTINGGTFQHLHTNTSGGVVICNRTKGTVYVNGGNFSGGNYYGNDNLSDYGYGGTFSVKGGVFSANPAAKYIADGYKSIEKGGKFYVVPENADAVATSAAELQEATKDENATVYVYPCTENEDGVYLLEGKLSLAEGVRLIGVGDEPVAVLNDWGSNAFGNQAHFTNTYVENISFTNNLIIDAGIANGNVRFKNCVFGGDRAHQGVHFDSGQGTITFDECRFIGRNMLGASIEKVTFNNCYFENKRSSQTGADKWTGVNMWGKYEFNNCTFDTEAHCNVKTDGIVANFNDCKFVDNRDITSLIWNGNGHTANITFDGNKYIAEGLMVDEVGNAFVSSPDMVEAALDNPHINTLYLNAGKYTIEVYDNFPDKESLTIIGTEGTQVEFANQQVRMPQCKNFTIENCEILHMATKTWGHLVFGSGNSADGVYTVSNCTFNGVGTQGIYINEEVSGAVYNIENCTFNGDFGGEGAITIQGNKDVKHIVNVEGCTFNNIPSTSHKICLVPSTAGTYFDFTLNTDQTLSVAIPNNTYNKAPYGNWYGIRHDGGVLDGNYLTVDFEEGPANNEGKRDNYGIMTSGGTIKNMTISGVFRGIVIMYPTEDIHIENVVFDAEDECGNGYSINTAEGDGTHSLYVKNSIVAGWNSIGTAVKDVHYSNCTFIQGSYYTNVYGRLSKPYVDAVYENCDFCSKYYIDLSALAAGQTVTIENCTVNGVKLTAENWTSLVASESTCSEGQISIELKDGSYLTADNVAAYVVIK